MSAGRANTEAHHIEDAEGVFVGLLSASLLFRVSCSFGRFLFGSLRKCTDTGDEESAHEFRLVRLESGLTAASFRLGLSPKTGRKI